jgi:addiction module RelB/DinJ family antitoxin
MVLTNYKDRAYNNIKEGVINMANTNVTMRIDETLKAQLQELMSSLGLDMTTFFTMAAKQAVREQALPFKPDMNTGIYGLQAYKLAMQNTNYNKEGKAVISSDDEWKDETEWDDWFEQLKKERGIE